MEIVDGGNKVKLRYDTASDVSLKAQANHILHTYVIRKNIFVTCNLGKNQNVHYN